MNDQRYFVAKYDPGGTLKWAKNLTVYNGDFSSMTLDNNGNILVSRILRGYYNYDDNYFYLTKLGSADGRQIWETKFDCLSFNGYGTEFSGFNYMTTNEKGHILLASTFLGDSLQVGKTILKGPVAYFILRFDSTGVFKNVIPWTTPDLPNRFDEYIDNILVDATGNYYMVHEYIGKDSLLHELAWHISVSKFDSSGVLKWFKLFKTANQDAEYLIKSQLDKENNIYITGNFTSSLSTDGFALYSDNNLEYGYLLKIDSSGKLQWGRKIEDSIESRGYYPVSDYLGLSLDSTDNVLVGRSFGGQITVNGKTYQNNDTFSGSGLLIKYNPSGYYQWAKNTPEIIDMANGPLGTTDIVGTYGRVGVFDTLHLSGNTVLIHKSIAATAYVAQISYPFQPPDSLIYKLDCKKDSVYFTFIYTDKPDSVLWDFGDHQFSKTIDPAHQYALSGNYHVILHKFVNHEDDSLIVNIHWEAPLLKRILPIDSTICVEKPFTINLLNVAGKVKWQDSSASKIYTITQPGTYKVSVTNGCGSFADSSSITTAACTCPLFVPNAFSPDGNAHNETFTLISECPFQEFDVFIYNRWGENVFHSSDPNIQWDGSFHGQPAPNDVYVWMVTYVNPGFSLRSQHGTVQVIR